MNTITNDLQLLLEDLQIHKVLKPRYAETAQKRFDKIIKAIRRNVKLQLDALADNKVRTLLQTCLENLNRSIDHTEQLALVTMIFILLMSDSEGQLVRQASFLTDLKYDIWKHI